MVLYHGRLLPRNYTLKYNRTDTSNTTCLIQVLEIKQLAMKKLALSALILTALLLSCQKEESEPASGKEKGTKYEIKFNVSGFVQSVEKFGLKLSKTPDAISVSPVAGSSVSVIYYLVYNSAGDEIYRLIQYSDGTIGRYRPDSEPEYSQGTFGTMVDSLERGSYTIVFLASEKPLGINWYREDENEVFTPLNSASFEYPGGLDDFSRAFDTFYKKTQLVVETEDIEQSLTLDRIVGKVVVRLEDQIPPNADHFKFFYQGETIGVQINTLATFQLALDEELAPEIPITAADRANSEYEYSKFISNTNSPIEVVINCYDAEDNLIARKAVPNVRVHKNKRTILTGKLFDSTTPAGFNILVNDEWDGDEEEIEF